MRDPVMLLALAASFLLILASPGRAALKLLDRPMWVFPGQSFRIAIGQPPGSGALTAEIGEGLEQFDYWPKDAIQRFYFRALKPGEAILRFQGAGGTLQVPIAVLPWSAVYEPRDYEGVKLPRIWPLGEPAFTETKTRHTLYSEQDLARLRAATDPVSDRAKAWLALPDEAIWNIIPGPAVPRTCLIVMGTEPARGKGCPICGTKVYEGRSGFYPWLFDAKNHPWKVGCPSCGTWFPSNDFHKGDMHSGDFPDDGFGCEPIKPVISPAGTPWRFPFIAYYHEWEAYMGTFTPGIGACAYAAVMTGDRRYAHKAAIGLFRYAESMLDMSLNLNHRKMAVRDAILRGPVGAPDIKGMERLSGSFLYIQPNWDTPRMEEAAQAWDRIFDMIGGDNELLRFCRDHYHPDIQTTEDFRRFVEAGVHRVPAQACLDNAVARNWPMQETTLATLALGMGYPRSLELFDWLLNGRGGIRFALANQYYKDGSGHESEGYNGIQIRDLTRLFMLLDRAATAFPDKYTPPRFVSLANDPKFRLLYDFPLDDSLIGRTYPSCGDTGGAGKPDIAVPHQGYPLTPRDFAEIYSLTRDPKFAQALWSPMGEVPAEVKDPALRAEVERVGKERGWQVPQESNILDGYGHAILRSGAGDRQRALWLRYGRYIQHAHPDMLTFGFEALQRKLLPEMGYPVGWTFASSWETNWGTHYVTHIGNHRIGDFAPGHLTQFADSAPARLATAESTYLSGEVPRPRRERTIVLVDINAHDCYAVTLERVFGGTTHYWSFHGPDGEATASGVELQAQRGGTMLGPDVPYADDTFARKNDPELSCFAFMTDVARGTPTGPWSLDYALRGQKGVHLRVTAVYPTDGRLATARGRAPGGKSDYEITSAIWQRDGAAPLESQFLTVLEPYEGKPLLEKVTLIPVETAGDGVAPLAVKVEGQGFTDTLIFQPSDGGRVSSTVKVGEVSTDASFAFWREVRGQATPPASGGPTPCAVLLGGTRLQKGTKRLTLSAPASTGIVQSCDWKAAKISVKFAVAAFPDPSRLVGKHVRITNEAGNDASYLVRGAQTVGDTVELSLGLDPRIGEGLVAATPEGMVVSAVAPPLQQWGYYAGKTIANENASAWYHVKDVARGDNILLTEPTPKARLAAEFADLDGDDLARYVIYDYGPGDTVEITAWCSGTPS